MLSLYGNQVKRINSPNNFVNISWGLERLVDVFRKIARDLNAALADTYFLPNSHEKEDDPAPLAPEPLSGLPECLHAAKPPWAGACGFQRPQMLYRDAAPSNGSYGTGSGYPDNTSTSGRMGNGRSSGPKGLYAA